MQLFGIVKKKHYQSLSKQYRKTGKGQLTKEEVEAYLTARMPATLAAISQVLREVHHRIGPIGSFLDIGAGPGTGLVAANEAFGEIKEAVLIEANVQMIAHKVIEGQWVAKKASEAEFPASDLVLFGYSYGEMEDPKILERAWTAARCLVIVEPGTPRGFETILRVRDQLIALGGHMVAPCPHIDRCPWRGTKDWCHFSARLERTREHKHLKQGSLGWEDEKFSYVAFSKESVSLTKGRILRAPQKGSGHLILELCCPEGVKKKSVTRSEKALYKRAKKLKWGESFSEAVVEEGEDDASY